MATYMYVRCSTEEQRKSGLGLKAQHEACERVAKERGLEVEAVGIDGGVSGAKDLDERSGFMGLYGVMLKGDKLLVSRVDRLGRDTFVCAMAERLLTRRGVELIVADGLGSGDDAEAKLMRALLAAFATYERVLIRTRIKAALAVKRAKGEPLGPPPYGYGYDERHRLVPKEPECAIRGKMVTWRRDGETAAEIAERLRRQGVATKTGRGQWSPKQVRRVLTQRLPEGVR